MYYAQQTKIPWIESPSFQWRFIHEYHCFKRFLVITATNQNGQTLNGPTPKGQYIPPMIHMYIPRILKTNIPLYNMLTWFVVVLVCRSFGFGSVLISRCFCLSSFLVFRPFWFVDASVWWRRRQQQYGFDNSEPFLVNEVLIKSVENYEQAKLKENFK